MEALELMEHGSKGDVMRTTAAPRCWDEPVVCRPEEALACFLRTDMDVLVLGDHVVARG